MKFLAAIDEIGKSIDGKNPTWENFPSVAAEELKATSLPSLFNHDSLEELRVRHTDCENKLGRKFNFSDECFYLYVGNGFTIELYHWLYSDTAIHDHDFQGAFQCLKGKNFQREYRFEVVKEVFTGFELGKLEELPAREIAPGNIELIRDEDRFIHVVSHEDSTFNLCIRTTKKGDRPLRTYHIDGIRFTVPDEIHDSEIENLSSEELLFIAHHGIKGNHARKLQACEMLLNRHGIDFISSQEQTWNFLHELSMKAKGL